MTSEEVSKYGIYFDDIYTLRVLEPDVATETNDLIDECSGYTESTYLQSHINIYFHSFSFFTELNEFRKISEHFIGITESFAKQVDIEKMRAIGAQNLLKTTSKQRETEQQELQVNKLR